MPIPSVNITIKDGGLGLDPAADALPSIKIGWCAGGVPNTVYSFASRTQLYATLIGGPAVEAAASSIATSGGPVDVMPITQTSAGSVGSVTHVGTGPTVSFPLLSAVSFTGGGSGVLTVSGTPVWGGVVTVKILVGGSSGTATFAVSYDGGKTYSNSITTGSSVALTGNGTGTVLDFASGTYDAADVYTFAQGVPYDAYELLLTVVGGGALGAATFNYALDALNPNGASTSATFTIPASGVYVIPGTGVAITFASGTYVAGDTYAALCTAPGYGTSTQISAAFTALQATNTEYSFVHLVGPNGSATIANSATIATLVDGAMAAAQALGTYAFACVEVPDGSDSTILADFSSFSSVRVSPCAGSARLASSGTGVTAGMGLSRNAAWPATTREAGLSGPGVDPSEFDLGPLPNVESLNRDENLTPALDAAGFTTLRTFRRQGGYYLTNGRFPAPSGSDYTLWQYRRVMDTACEIVADVGLSLLSKSYLANADGTINQTAANAINAQFNQALANGLVNTTPKSATAAVAAVDTTTNFVSTNTLNVSIAVQPLGYAKTINITIGLVAQL